MTEPYYFHDPLVTIQSDAEREQLRKQLEADIEAFFCAGGKVDAIPGPVSSVGELTPEERALAVRRAGPMVGRKHFEMEKEAKARARGLKAMRKPSYT
jgi:hypothetical protein